MNSKERILSAYRCKEVDRIPVISAVNPYGNLHWIQKEPSYRAWKRQNEQKLMDFY